MLLLFNIVSLVVNLIFIAVLGFNWGFGLAVVLFSLAIGAELRRK